MMYRSPTAIAYQLPQGLPTATGLVNCHRAWQRYTAYQLPHNSLTVYSSATATACQRYTACQLPHSSLIVYSSATATAYQLPQSLPTVYSLPTATLTAVGCSLIASRGCD